jgi:hypothetical protein
METGEVKTDKQHPQDTALTRASRDIRRHLASNYG